MGRKLAIQILEYFDRIGFTRRRGNEHLLRDSALFNSAL
ncbi:Selenocysteine-specific translation elongation factor [Cronobacter dublinensis 582]|nr:SelB C-terminal domain-containing protein [Cronobacter sakazakii]CCJ87118.1 Selenocysteine-specific translation elongation factor [Cronobacter dublinensis 582]